MFVLLFLAVGVISAQEETSIRGLHKVKRKETIFGISRMYDLTIDELIQANPEMKDPDYEMKKGDIIRIPYSRKSGNISEKTDYIAKPTQDATSDDVRNRAIRLGVMLPLHDINGDGRRMVEYYRGVLMACDSLKKLGISVDVHAWNTPEMLISVPSCLIRMPRSAT